MNLFERFQASFKVLTGKAEIAANDGKPELSEENVAALEAAADEVKELRESNATLKDEAQTAATTISELEAAAQTAKDEKEATEAKVETLASTLANYNVKVEEGENALDVANTTLEAWAKRSGLATAATTTTEEDLDGKKDEFYSQTDEDVKAARAQIGLK
jgi:chromosome segregation ATPase